MATSNLRFRIIGDDDASDDFLRAAASARALNQALNGIGANSPVLGIAAAITPLVPVLAAASAATAELGTSLASAGGAAGVFGLSAGGLIVQMKKQQQTIAATSKSLSNYAKGTDEYRKVLTKLHRQQATFNRDFGPAAKGFNTMKLAFDDFLEATGPVTKGVLAKGFDLVASVLPRLVPVSNAAGKAVGGLIDDLTKWTKGPEFNAVLKWLKTSGPAAITAFGHSVGNVVEGLGGIFSNFVGPADRAAATLQRLTNRFEVWGKSKGVSESVNSFLTYVSENGDKITSVLSSLAQAAPKLASAFGDLGSVNLTAISLFLNLIAEMPQGVFDVVVKGIFGIVVATKALNIAFSVNALLQAFKLGLDAVQEACIGTRIQLAGLAIAQNKLRFGSAIGGLGALAASTQTSNDKLSGLLQILGGAGVGFATGGPIGAAIGALAGALPIFAQHMHSAGDAAKVAKADFSGLKGTFDQLTGAITGNTRETVKNQLVHSGTLTTLAKYGISTRTAIDAILGEGNARKVVSAAVRSQTDAIAEQRRQIGLLTAANVADQKAGTLTPQANAERKKQVDAYKAQIAAEQNVIDTIRKGIPTFKRYHQRAIQNAIDTQDWAGKLRGFPKVTRTYIQANGVVPTLKGIASVAKAYDLTPKQIATLIQVTGVDTTVKQIKLVEKNMTDVNKVRPDLSAYQAVLRNQLDQAGGIARAGGTEIGNALGSGLSSAVHGWTGSIARDSADLVSNAILAARRAADAHSPSRKMIRLGNDMAAGLALGLRSDPAVKVFAGMTGSGSARVVLDQPHRSSGRPVQITVQAPVGTDAYTIGEQLKGYLDTYLDGLPA